MTQAAWGGLDDNAVPTRYVFDEGHHVFDAADSAFSAALSGHETAELRRWLLGAEGGRSRARGLARRIEELVAGRPELETPLDAALQAARALPAPGWSARLGDVTGRNSSEHRRPAAPNPTEAFLRLVRHQVLARIQGTDGEPSRLATWGAAECDVFPIAPDLPPAADRLARALRPHRRAARHAARTPAGPAGRRGRGDGRRHPQPHRGDRPLACTAAR